MHANGALDTAFHPSIGRVYCVALQVDGRILIGGQFETVGGQPRACIARLNADGTLDQSFNPSADNSVRSIAVQADGKIVIGGWFTSVAGQTRNYIARLNADGSLDAAFNPGANGAVRAVMVQSSGKIIVGGDFSEIGGQPRSRVGRIENDPSTQTFAVPDATRVQWLRGGSAPELAFASFERSIDDGATWVPLGTGVRMAGGWELTAINLQGLRGLVRARGRTVGGLYNGSSGLIEQTASFNFDFAEPPTLTAPASGSVWRNPATVTFILPQQALAGSVKVKFGTDAQTLVLAGSQESAGLHSFSFDPANPVGTSGGAVASIASGAIADGTYTVTLTYEDTHGHAPTSAENTNVTIDTTPPVLSGSFSPTSFVAGTDDRATLPDYTAQAQITDATAVSVVQSPVSGSAIGQGDTVVTLTGTDAAGNVGTTEFTVNVVSGFGGMATIAVSGDDIPGAGSGGIPVEAKWVKFGVPSLNDIGWIAFLGTWASPAGTGQGLFRIRATGTLELLASVGETLATGPAIKSFAEPVLGQNGKITVLARLSGVGVTTANDSAVLAIDVPGSAAVLAREGDVAPGTDGAKFAAFKSLSRREEETLFLATLKLGTGTPCTTAATNSGLWSHTNWWGLELSLRKGQTLDTRAGPKRMKAFKALAPMSGTPGVGRTHADDDTKVALALFFDGTSGLVKLAHPGDVDVLAITGGTVHPALPAMTWKSFSMPAAGIDQPTCAVLGTVTDIGKAARAIFAGDAFAPQEIARVGGPAGDGLTFRTLRNPIYRRFSRGYCIGFPATLAGPGVKSTNDTALYAGPTGAVERVAREGDPAPDAPGTTFRSFKALAIFGNTNPSPVWVAQLGGRTIRASNDRGLWARNSVGTPHLLLREGQALGGRIVKTFAVLSSVAGSPDVTRSVNARRSVIVRVDFTDRIQALVQYDMP